MYYCQRYVIFNNLTKPTTASRSYLSTYNFHLFIMEGPTFPKYEGKFTNSDYNNRYLFMDMYKTVICKAFAVNGWCHYGNGCFFAHGFGELRRRRQKCVFFYDIGVCPFGDQCEFSHGDFDILYPRLSFNPALVCFCLFPGTMFYIQPILKRI